MRSTVIPAQITTVEDKIVGNLNLTQILLLMMPVLIGTMLFVLVPPLMEVSGIKICLFLFSTISSLILAIRFRSRVILEWLLIWLKFKLRPNIYVFDKNNDCLRQIEKFDSDENRFQKIPKKIIKKEEKVLVTEVDQVRWQRITKEENNSLIFEFNQKGGLHVAVEPIKR